ncbi:RsfA family transcription factor [Bacillus cereus VD133]|uniref:RsfA family transcription factor n=1 Tax=Bacillus cereus VD133 TaxID=1053233 RepID=A0A9W5V0J5_BACCE|nr:BRO family protein [Bacillus cereus]EOO29789.1 RsfA family transcription factor [Bacillus cereus VD133]
MDQLTVVEEQVTQNQLNVIEQRVVLGKEFRIYGTVEEPLFIAKDVADWIEYKGGVSLLMRSVDEDEKGIYNIKTLGGNQQNWFLTEDGIYEVLMQSRKPIAKQFKKQVKAILKQIRQTGGYGNNTNQLPELSPQLQVLINMEMKQKELEKQVAMIKNEIEGKYSLPQPIVEDVEEQATPKVTSKKRVRYDSWSEKENELLASVMLKHIRKGNTTGKAYKEVGRKLRRTPDACRAQWNRTLRSLYADEAEKARACYINRITKNRLGVKKWLSMSAEQKQDLLIMLVVN